MKVKVSELQGAALDWAVAHCDYTDPETCFFIVNYDGFKPSTDWSQGGPIIDPVITKVEDYGDCWGAEGPDAPEQFGPTILIAAMRCYVASKLGDEIEIPEEVK